MLVQSLGMGPGEENACSALYDCVCANLIELYFPMQEVLSPKTSFNFAEFVAAFGSLLEDQVHKPQNAVFALTFDAHLAPDISYQYFINSYPFSFTLTGPTWGTRCSVVSEAEKWSGHCSGRLSNGLSVCDPIDCFSSFNLTLYILHLYILIGILTSKCSFCEVLCIVVFVCIRSLV